MQSAEQRKRPKDTTAAERCRRSRARRKVERPVATALGACRATVAKIGRHLREEGRGLWLSPSSLGRSQLEPAHAANLLLALAAGPPIAAVKTAIQYGALRCTATYRTVFDAEGRPAEEPQDSAPADVVYLGSDRVPVHPTLAATIAGLIQAFMDPALEVCPCVEVALGLDEPVRANLFVNDGSGEYRALFLPGGVEPDAVPVATVIWRAASIGTVALLRLAEICKATIPVSRPVRAQKAPGRESGAPTGAPPSSDLPVITEEACLTGDSPTVGGQPHVFEKTNASNVRQNQTNEQRLFGDRPGRSSEGVFHAEEPPGRSPEPATPACP